MTNRPISEMTDQEIDTALAEFMGWMKSEPGMAGEYQFPSADGTRVIYSWHPHDDLNQVWQCEEKIIKLGLVEKYSQIICGYVSVIQGKTMLFNIMHSTARERCEAMLIAVRGENENSN